MKYTVDEKNKEIIFLEDASYEELLDFLQTHSEFKLWEIRLTNTIKVYEPYYPYYPIYQIPNYIPAPIIPYTTVDTSVVRSPGAFSIH